MDGVYDRLDDDLEIQAKNNLVENLNGGQIRKFYRDKNILLTGSTGYIGKSVLEKLLRTCTDVGKIYVLIREKHGLTIEERMAKCLKSLIFETVRETNPEYAKHVIPIDGDLMKDGLGLSPEDRQTLVENVDIIIHNGATEYFEGKISRVLRANVLGTQKMIELASHCSHLRAFLYCSSAFSHCHEEHIQEKYYEQSVDLEVVYDVIKTDEILKNGISQKSLCTLLGPWANIYVFSKAIAESLVKDFSMKAACPVAIFRPSIVTSTYKEPITGWCGNRNGPVAIFSALLLGLVHVLYWKTNHILDCIPSDMTANAFLAIAWDLAVNKKPKGKYVYNYATSTLAPLRINDSFRLGNKFVGECPTVKSFWYVYLFPVQNLFLFHVLNFNFHIVPMCIIDLMLLLRGQKPFILKTALKYYHHFSTSMSIASQGLAVEIKEMVNIWNLMDPVDQKEFFCDIRAINWEEYFSTYWRGIRVYILNDPMHTLPLAEARTKKLFYINCIAVPTLFILTTSMFLYFVYIIGSWLWIF